MGEAFFVMYKNLRAFSVGSYISIDWKWDKKYIQPLSKALHRKIIEVKRRQTSLENLQLATIHFDGSIEPRILNGKNTFKGRLFYAHSGDVVYSKIDVRNGAIGIIPPGMPEVAVSSEYPVYSVDAEIANPNYIHLVFRTPIFQRILNSMISGASGRKRVQPGQIEEVNIPLPPLDVQHAIVARWQEAQKSAGEAEEKARQLGKDIIFAIKKRLGRNIANITKEGKAFVLNWSGIDRWGVGIARQNPNQSITSLFLIRRVNELCKVSSGGTPSRKIPQYFRGDIPWVKTTEVRGDVIYETEEHISQEGLQNSSARIYPKGSLLVAMYGQGATRGRTAKLGIDAATNQACAVLTKFSSEINPDYLWIYLMGEYEELRAMASGNNQPNINAAMIANYPVPVPPLDIQREITEQFFEGRTKVALQRERATQIRREAEAEVEAMILGTKQA